MNSHTFGWFLLGHMSYDSCININLFAFWQVSQISKSLLNHGSLNLRMLIICLTDHTKHCGGCSKLQTMYFSLKQLVFIWDFRAMVDVPRLSVSGYYYIIISTALDLLLFWAQQFYLLGNINYIVLLYPGAGYIVCGWCEFSIINQLFK